MDRNELNAIIDLHLADVDGEVDLHDVARDIAHGLPADVLAEACALTMHAYLRAYVGLQRITALAPHSPAVAAAEQAAPLPGKPRRLVAQESYRRRMDALVAIGCGVHKRLAECTVIDIEFQVDKIDAQITAATHRREWYERLAKAMRDHGVDTVAELPTDVLAALLGEDDQ